MKIVMINGIRTDPLFMWDEFRTEFERVLPGAKFVVETEPNCLLREIGRFRSFTRRTVERHDTGEDLLLVGHSLGGVLACAMEPLFKKSKVIGIATIHSPHQYFFGICSRVFHAGTVCAPVISFQGLHDWLVWWGTKHPQARRHVRNHADHFNDLWEYSENARMIVNVIMEEFFHDMTAATV